LRALVEDIEDRLGARDRAGIGLAELERQATAARALQELFLRDSLTVAAERALVRPWLKVIQAASPPSAPSAPNTKVLLVLGAVAGGIAGAVLAHLAEFRADTFRRARDVAHATRAPVLALVPRVRSRPRLPTPLDHLRERPALAGRRPADRGPDRHARQHRPRKAGCRVVLVTSCQPGEGKSTVAMSLALLAAPAATRRSSSTPISAARSSPPIPRSSRASASPTSRRRRRGLPAASWSSRARSCAS
jgi:hypothetical protein